ncbi:trypsin-3-like [Belonocnema kinseyi]|uniref:trypsin-3-like n=1 Tax=Belonocnema kinseyi TaxID=2817044 RepID=UPI00143E0E1D|nr:trypsin-3-like [Belonocnema kinseyi]
MTCGIPSGIFRKKLWAIFTAALKRRKRTGEEDPSILRSVLVSVISQEQCQSIYNNSFHITDKHICARHDLKYSSGDHGNSLVVQNHLAGLFLWRGSSGPDVFVKLSGRMDYRNWINLNMERYI